jgi:hypothetical protein
MERKSMKRNNLYRLLGISMVALSTFSACAQEHQTNTQRLAQTNAIINNTVLLNNQDNLVPISNLSDLQIASVSQQ